ncbi:MAG: NAD(P)-binding domain-containing protein, partial [Rhodospirillaceae bacterium]|nr:NAD(P)-binding domain-containing protein [Rhodospirillaceae bacterium]
MLGFIGTGAVTEAVVTGLSTAPGTPPDIVLSPRSAGRAAALSRRFANVAVADDNAMVLALADTVVLALRPQDAAAALAPLRFRPEQTVVSVMALVPMARLKALVAPAERICRALPLPAAALRTGPVGLWPALADVAALLGRIGTVVAVAEEVQLEALWATTALMAPFYETLDGIARWLAEQGVPQAQAADYVAGLVAAWGAATAG